MLRWHISRELGIKYRLLAAALRRLEYTEVIVPQCCFLGAQGLLVSTYLHSDFQNESAVRCIRRHVIFSIFTLAISELHSDFLPLFYSPSPLKLLLNIKSERRVMNFLETFSHPIDENLHFTKLELRCSIQLG